MSSVWHLPPTIMKIMSKLVAEIMLAVPFEIMLSRTTTRLKSRT